MQYSGGVEMCARKSKTATHAPVAKPTVMVVDDEPFMKDLVTRVLGQKYRVLAAASVPEAESQLADTEIQVIVCDYLMPGEDGLSFMKRLGRSRPEIQRIILTGNSDTGVLKSAINQAQVFRFLEKPVPLEELQHTVAAGFREYRRQQEERQLAAKARDQDEAEERWWRRFMRWTVLLETIADITTGTAAKASAILITGVILATVLGIVGFAAVYGVKTFLGFDLIEHLHLSDVIARLTG